MARGPNWDATAISESACYFTTNPSAPSGYDILRQLVSDFFPDLINYRTSVGVAYMNLIELVVECLSVVHLAVKTACKQASYTEPAFEMPRPSTLRAVERLPMRSDRN